MTGDVAGPWGVRVLAERCKTCIFRPGNKMSLNKGRLADLLATCEHDEGHIPCHETLWTDGADAAICRGFYETATADRSLAIRYGRITRSIVEIDPPPGDFIT